MHRLFISAAHKSSGKTTVSIGLAAALTKRGNIVQTFKKGPDYIDPQWLAKATTRACYNLDFYTMQKDEILSVIQEKIVDADFCLIEGNKGLYDGLDIDGSNSNAALAKLTNTPVVLVLDARGMTRGIAPLILGYQAFDKDINIKGVILNQLGGSRHENKLRRVIEHYTDVDVIGAIQKDTRFDIDERHLGLVPSHEDPYADQKINQLAQAINDQVDLDKIIQLSSHTPLAPSIPVKRADYSSDTFRLGIIRDPAFGFYYPDDLDTFNRHGAQPVFINALTDNSLPEIDGLFIGGGFPETHLEALSANASLRTEIKQRIDDGLPCYAECGGLMYLSNSIEWQGQTFDMVGSIDGEIIVEDRPQGRGYVQLEATSQHPWPNIASNTIYAHEFHYSRFKRLNKNATFAYNVKRGTGINGKQDGYIFNNLLASYTHQRDTLNNHWISHFTDFIKQKLSN